MQPRFKLLSCAAAVAMAVAGCAWTPSGGGASTTAASAATNAPMSPASASAARSVEIDALFRQGRQHLLAGRPRTAIEYFAVLLDREPHHVEALNALGVAVAELDRLPEAISVLRRAAALAPQAVHVRNNLGQALYRAREFEQARAEWNAALALQPDNALARRNLALLDHAAPAAGIDTPPAPTGPAAMAQTVVPQQGSSSTAAATAAPVATVAPDSSNRAAASMAVQPRPASSIRAATAPVTQPGLSIRAATAGIDPALPPRETSAVARAPQPRSWSTMFGLDQPPGAPADERAARQPDRMVLRMLGLDGGGVAQAKAPDSGLQRAKASAPDRAFEQRPVQAPRYAPHFIRVRPVEPVERTPKTG